MDEAAAKKYIQDAIVKRVKDQKGSITFEDFWGARGFAYMINKEKWGYYYVAQFEAEADTLDELQKDWHLDKGIVRFLVSIVDTKAPAPKTHEQIEEDHKAREQEEKIEAAEKEAKKVAKTKATTKESKKDDEDAPEEKPAKKAASKDAIDNKLDQILEDSALDL